MYTVVFFTLKFIHYSKKSRQNFLPALFNCGTLCKKCNPGGKVNVPPNNDEDDEKGMFNMSDTGSLELKSAWLQLSNF